MEVRPIAPCESGGDYPMHAMIAANGSRYAIAAIAASDAQ